MANAEVGCAPGHPGVLCTEDSLAGRLTPQWLHGVLSRTLCKWGALMGRLELMQGAAWAVLGHSLCEGVPWWGAWHPSRRELGGPGVL